jgi:hypothetical protein
MPETIHASVGWQFARGVPDVAAQNDVSMAYARTAAMRTRASTPGQAIAQYAEKRREDAGLHFSVCAAVIAWTKPTSALNGKA